MFDNVSRTTTKTPAKRRPKAKPPTPAPVMVEPGATHIPPVRIFKDGTAPFHVGSERVGGTNAAR